VLEDIEIVINCIERAYMKKEIKMSEYGRYYAHYESDMVDGRYKIEYTYPLGTNIEIVKKLLKEGYRFSKK